MQRETPWKRAKDRRSQRQEERIGNMPGGSKQVNSGRTWRSKRDAILHFFLIEARTTESGSYRLEKKEFQDIRRQALLTPPGLLPAMQIDLGDLQLIVIELDKFQELNMQLIELQTQIEQLRGKG